MNFTVRKNMVTYSISEQGAAAGQFSNFRFAFHHLRCSIHCNTFSSIGLSVHSNSHKDVPKCLLLLSECKTF